MKKKNKEIAIQLSHVTKTYELHHEKPTFAEKMIHRQTKETFTALNDISLTIYKGEKVGIIGANGSGKTTLLKIIAGITTPNKGRVKTKGKIVSLIDLEAGFHPDLTGIENIYLNGLVIGMSKKEVIEKLDQIIEFADIGNFIDAPLYTYSAGMKLRLGFSIAVHADPDILILDEGISAGDQSFQKKSGEKIEEFFKANKTILVVSHWIEYLEKHVNRVLWIEKSRVKKDGGKRVIGEYVGKTDIDERWVKK
jgi:ABC-type polysaccharide/polyol phosphate transport system ATPase subunit